MTKIKSCLDFLKEEKILDLEVYKNFQNLDCIIGIATSVRLMNKIKKQFLLSKNFMEGCNTSWGILSFQDFDCHLFLKEVRDYYGLDGLWRNNGRV